MSVVSTAFGSAQAPKSQVLNQTENHEKAGLNFRLAFLCSGLLFPKKILKAFCTLPSTMPTHLSSVGERSRTHERIYVHIRMLRRQLLHWQHK